MPGHCFETICFKNGQLLNLGRHEYRLNRTRRLLWGAQDFLSLQHLVIPPGHPDEPVYKCRVTYSREIETIEWEPYLRREVSSLRLVTDNTISYDHKFKDRSRIQLLAARKEGCDDVLIVRNGLVTDTSIANVAFFDGLGWITPDQPLLPGTQRARLLGMGTIREEAVHVSALDRFTALRIFNAMIPWEDAPTLHLPHALRK